jgi:uncharacterized protein YoaH (UPF0181 family)
MRYVLQIVSLPGPIFTFPPKTGWRTRAGIGERLLLHSLSHEASQAVRRKAVDSIRDLANNSMSCGRPWHALQAQAFSMCQSQNAGLRDGAYRVFAGCPNLVMDLQTDAVLGVFQKGLQDAGSNEVRNVKSHVRF